MDAKFLLKEPNGKGNTLISMFFRFNGKRLVFSTGYQVTADNWLSDIQRCRQHRDFRQGKIINSKLDKMASIMKDTYLELNCPSLSVIQLKNEFERRYFNVIEEEQGGISFIAYFEQHKDWFKNKYGIESSKKFTTTINHLKEFFKLQRKEYNWNDIDIEFAELFEEFLYSMDSIKSQNYVSKIITVIKTVMKAAYEKELHSSKKYERIKHSDIEVFKIYLTITELERIYNLDVLSKDEVNKPENELKQCEYLKLEQGEAHVRDAFLISCFTGLRYIDINRLKKEHFSDERIHIVTTKTNTPIVIPVHPKVKSIIEKRNWKLIMYKNAVMNRYLKEIGKKAKIIDSVIESKIESRKKVDNVHEKWELITFHTARRSFVTNLLLNGATTLSIMKMTGHKTEKAFQKYIKMTSEQNANMIKSNPFFN